MWPHKRALLQKFSVSFFQIFERLSSDLAPAVSSMLEEILSSSSSSTCHDSLRESHQRLLSFLDEQLIFLKEWLVQDNFDRALASIWSVFAMFAYA